MTARIANIAVELAPRPLFHGSETISMPAGELDRIRPPEHRFGGCVLGQRAQAKSRLTPLKSTLAIDLTHTVSSLRTACCCEQRRAAALLLSKKADLGQARQK